ncbi:hypothetical protein [Flavobacterium sp. N1994]|uniref:hypothetical protein n=1 Tax=Flavobacterium sp. N1994 TaxID=2986827 RepID=UPI00222243D2|nr:hypothetical protein [Flavobacterium sp. N1994]
MGILELIGSIITASIASGFLTSIFMRSKYKQDIEKIKVEVLQGKEAADSVAIDNDIKLSSHYKDIIGDLKQRYEDRVSEFEQMMNRKVSMLEEEIKLQARKIKLQQQEITELKKENRQLKSANK